MHFQILSTLAILNAAITFALPTELKDFLLVTTSQAEPTIDSKDLKAVSASSLFVSKSYTILGVSLLHATYRVGRF